MNYSSLYCKDMSDRDFKNAIAVFWQRHRRMPVYSELMKITGFRSKNAVFKLIDRLVESGYLSKDAKGHLSPGDPLYGTKMLGLVEAGFPSPAEEELLDVISFDEYLTPNKENSYILKVKGDSMIDAGIMDGDMIVVEKRSQYKPGQIVVAIVDGEYTLKYLRKKDTSFYLEPANKNFQPIYPENTLSIEAVLTGVVRKY